jgi:hypothetical protein
MTHGLDRSCEPTHATVLELGRPTHRALGLSTRLAIDGRRDGVYGADILFLHRRRQPMDVS